MSGTARFDCYPSDFLNGIIGLSADEIAAYTVVMMMHYDRGEPIPYAGRERELMVRTGLTRARLDRVLERLVDLGKLQWVGTAIGNPRAERELEKIRENLNKNRENSHKGGEATREKWKEFTSKNNDDPGPSGTPNGRPRLGPNLLPSPSTIKNPPQPPSGGSGQGSRFDEFVSAYPADSEDRLEPARVLFEELSEADQGLAIKGARCYAERIAKGERKVASARKWLREKGWVTAGQANGSNVVPASRPLAFVPADTPAFDAWMTFLRIEKWPGSERWKHQTTESREHAYKRGWFFPSHWPPGHDPPAEAPSEAQHETAA